MLDLDPWSGEALGGLGLADDGDCTLLDGLRCECPAVHLRAGKRQEEEPRSGLSGIERQALDVSSGERFGQYSSGPDPAEDLFAMLLTQAPGQRIYFRNLFRSLVYAALD